MSAINAAWEMIGDAEARRAYDEGRARGCRGNAGRRRGARHPADGPAPSLPDRAAASGPTAAARCRVA